MGAVPLQLIGQRYGRLVVIDNAPKAAGGRARWLCKCDCGNLAIVKGNNLRRQIRPTRSCGCLYRETRFTNNLQHGGAGNGSRRRPLYSMWNSIKGRCLCPTNAAYKWYGGRGITVSPEWIHDFAAFEAYILANLGPKPTPKHSIDRIDNDFGYCPGNLKWSTQVEQVANSRPMTVPRCGVPGTKRGVPCRQPAAPDGGPCRFHADRS